LYFLLREEEKNHLPHFIADKTNDSHYYHDTTASTDNYI